ncbi:hypothetical protein ANN_19876 [Periplaneta americana]|uniref:Uncharacterized protein n=1 Tax=Periplaneta americana TaxID=6978 RepID=A0ABQ8SB22_PERAM|nr:hypothetical protein ANN_19876 [Periplaneta americana]
MAGLCEGGNEPSGSLKAICNLVHACLSLAVLVHCAPDSLRKASDHLLLGRLLLLFPTRGSHMVEAYVHLLQSILLTCPPHFHLRLCASLTASCIPLLIRMSVFLILSWTGLDGFGRWNEGA